jgi:hypothetical protein
MTAGGESPQAAPVRRVAAISRGYPRTLAASSVSLGLRILKASIPGEHNVLLNPLHPDFAHVKIRAERPFRFDPRL